MRAASWGVTISQIIVRERPQVVQLATVDDCPLGLWISKWVKLPFVIYAHGNEILSVLYGGWEKHRLALRRADRVLAISHFTANLVQKAGVERDRIEVIQLGCEIDHFRPLSPKNELRQKLLGSRYRDRVILTVGNIVARKGHDMVIRSLPAILRDVNDVTYLIIGDGPYRGYLEQLAMAVGVHDHVIFGGRVSDEDLPDIYALADVFVMPGREQSDACDVEGFGLVYLEANACAKPTIGGRSGGIPDAVEDGVTGLLVDPNDPENIADAIKRLLTDSALAMRMGQEGRLRVIRDFNWASAATRIQKILENVVQDRVMHKRVFRRS